MYWGTCKEGQLRTQRTLFFLAPSGFYTSYGCHVSRRQECIAQQPPEEDSYRHLSARKIQKLGVAYIRSGGLAGAVQEHTLVDKYQWYLGDHRSRNDLVASNRPEAVVVAVPGIAVAQSA